METEYQVMQEWRNSKVNTNYVMTSIFLPVSISLLLYSFSEDAGNDKWIVLLASAGLIVFWRYYAYHIDNAIIATYPRICALERGLNYRFTQEYLKSIWWSHMKENREWLPPLDEVEEKIYKLKWWEKCTTRGHNWLNGFAFIILYFDVRLLIPYIF